jgi:hypothetical protein
MIKHTLVAIVGMLALVPVLCIVGESCGLVGVNGCGRIYLGFVDWILARSWIEIIALSFTAGGCIYAKRSYDLSVAQYKREAAREIQPVYGITQEYLKNVIWDRSPDAFYTHEKATQAWWNSVREIKPSLSQETVDWFERIFNDASRLDHVRRELTRYQDEADGSALSNEKRALILQMARLRDALEADATCRKYPILNEQ